MIDLTKTDIERLFKEGRPGDRIEIPGMEIRVVFEVLDKVHGWAQACADPTDAVTEVERVLRCPVWVKYRHTGLPSFE